MKVTLVTVAIGPTLTPIPSTIPAKFCKIMENAAIPEKSFSVSFKQSDGSFSNEVIYLPGQPIRVQGYSGIIGRPPSYVAYNTPSVGDPIVKMRATDNSEVQVKVVEYENTPLGED